MPAVSLNSSPGRWIMASSILASSMAFIDGTALNVVLPSIQKDLNATAADLFWVLNAFLLMLASLVLLGGSLGDKLGRKKVFITGIAIFLFGSTACGLAPDICWLILFRALQGIGGALMIPGSLSLISASFVNKERGKAIGTWSAITTVVTIGGPILGGALGDAGLWRFIFFINIPFGVASIIILLFKVKESKDDGPDHSVDYPGAISAMLGLALLTFGFLRIPVSGLHNWQVYISLTAGSIFLIVFILIEKNSKHAMMPLNLFANRTFSGVNLLTFFLYAGLSGGMLFLILNLVQAQGYSQLLAGLTFLPFTILMVSIARFSGNLVDKYGPRWLLIIGPATAGLGLLLLSFVKQTSGPSEYWTTFFPGIFLFGLGMSFTVAPLTTTVMGALPDHYSGTASGINNAMTRIASVFANAIFGALAILFFSNFLDNQVENLTISNKSKNLVLNRASNLGDATVPVSISGQERNKIHGLYKQGFLKAYGKVMMLCALLALLGAVVSFIFIKNGVINKQET